jgi:hypothetical protein
MTVIVPHHTTVESAIGIVDRSADNLFEDVAGGLVELVDQKHDWKGPHMDFSLTARAGFVSVPISGTIVVDEVNVTVYCELPAMVQKFVGEDKIYGSVERRVRGMLGA